MLACSASLFENVCVVVYRKSGTEREKNNTKEHCVMRTKNKEVMDQGPLYFWSSLDSEVATFDMFNYVSHICASSDYS